MGQVIAASLLSTALTLLVLWRYELGRERQQMAEEQAEAAYTFRIHLAEGFVLELESDADSRDAVRAALASFEGDWYSQQQLASHVANYLAAERIARDLGCRSLWSSDDDGGYCDARR